MKEVLKSLLKSQQYTVDVKSLNMHTSSLEMHPSNISDSEEEAEKKLMSVNAVYQQSSKVASQWKATQNPASQIQKEQQQKNAKFFSIKAVQEDIYCET